MKRHIPFSYRNLFPVFNNVSLAQDKALVSEITSNDLAACDNMFIPEFMEVLKYAEKRFKERYVRNDGMMPLS